VKDDFTKITNDQKMNSFLKIVWDKASQMFGNSYPYGGLYEKMFSIVRFVAAWNPKTGRQSEMRVLYNFVSLFGEKIEVSGKWKFLDFFLIPTYDDVKNQNFTSFPKFREMFEAVEKMWPVHYRLKGVYQIVCDKHKFKRIPKAYTQDEANIIRLTKQNQERHKSCNLSIIPPSIELFAADTGLGKNIGEFETKFTNVWTQGRIITSDERAVLKRLVSAFNRNPSRTSYFIWSLMSIFEKDYETYDKDYYSQFYELAEDNHLKGVSPKVVGCFLQQGFAMEEIIPIDTWVGSFHKGPLGIDSKFDFFSKFNLLGKFERLIWNVSQAKKTNADPIINSLWCIRFGQTGNHVIRGANPLSCYACDLHDSGCLGFDEIKNEIVRVIEQTNVNIVDINGDDKKNKMIDDQTILQDLKQSTYKFVCITESFIPKRIFLLYKNRVQLFDEFSADRITNNVQIQEGTYTVLDFMKALGKNKPPSGVSVEEA
jgi:hypothetical protein